MRKILYCFFILFSISSYGQNGQIDTSKISIVSIKEVLYPQMKIEDKDIFTTTEYCNLGQYDIEGFRMPRLYLDFRAGLTTQIDNGEKFGFWQINVNWGLAQKVYDYDWVTIGYDELDRVISALKYINNNMVSLPSDRVAPFECYYAPKNRNLRMSATNTYDKSWVLSVGIGPYKRMVKITKGDLDYLIALLTNAKNFIDRKL